MEWIEGMEWNEWNGMEGTDSCRMKTIGNETKFRRAKLAAGTEEC